MAADENKMISGKPGEDIQETIINLWDMIYRLSDKYDSIRKQNASKNEEIKNLNARLDAERSSRDELSGAAGNMEQKIEIAEQEIHEKNLAIVALEEKLAKAREFEDKYNRINSEYEALLSENNDYKNRASGIPELTRQLNEERELHSGLKIRTDELTAEIEKLRNTGKDLEFTKKEIARKNVELHSKSEKLLEQKNRLSYLESRQREYDEVVSNNARLTLENTSLKDKIWELENKLDNSTGEIYDLNRTIENIEYKAESEKAASGKIIIQKKATIDKYSNIIIDNKLKIIKLCRQAADAGQQNSFLSDKLKKALESKKDILFWKDKYYKLMKEYEEAEEKIFTIHEQSQGVKLELRGKEEVINNLNSELSVLKSRYEALKENTEKAENIIKDLKNEKFILEGRIDQMKKELDESGSRIKTAEGRQDEIKNLISENENLKMAIINKDMQADESEGLLKNLRNEKILLESRISEKEKDLETFKDKIRSLDNEINRYKALLESDNDKGEKLEKLNQVISSQAFDIDELRSENKNLRTLNDEFRSLKNNAEQKRKDLLEEKQEIEAKLVALMKEKEINELKLNNSLNLAEEEKLMLEARIKNIESGSRKISEEKQILESDLKARDINLQEFKAAKELLEMEIKKKEEEISDSIAKIQELESRLGQIEQKLVNSIDLADKLLSGN